MPLPRPAGGRASRLTFATVVTATKQDLGVYVRVYTCIYTFGVYTRVYWSKLSVYHNPGYQEFELPYALLHAVAFAAAKELQSDPVGLC